MLPSATVPMPSIRASSPEPRPPGDGNRHAWRTEYLLGDTSAVRVEIRGDSDGIRPDQGRRAGSDSTIRRQAMHMDGYTTMNGPGFSLPSSNYFHQSGKDTGSG